MPEPVIKYYKSADKQFSIVCGRGISKRFPVHRHLSYSIGAIIEGVRLLKIRDRKYIIGEGDIFIINSEEPHAVGENINPVHDYIVLSVTRSFVEKSLGKGFLSENIIEDQDLTYELTRWFNELMNYDNMGVIPNVLETVRKLRSYKRTEIMDIPVNSSVQRIKDLLDKDACNNYSIESLADKAFLSPFHFSRIFKKQTGLAPHQYLLDNRLRQARELLENNYSVIDIAIACGFYDASHFIRHFTNYYGVSPLEFQKGINQLS